MLEQIPQYHALSLKEKVEITRRLAKIEAAYCYPEREHRIRAEIQKIAAELRRRPAPREA